MEKKKTTDEHIFSMNYRNFILMMFSIVVGTNTGTGLIFNQEQNTKEIEYNKQRSDRTQHQLEEDLKQDIYISELKQEITRLKNKP